MRRTRAKITYGKSGSSSRTANSRNKDQHSLDSSWERLLRIANYEINDPYRGIINCSDDSPWKICCEASSQHEVDKVTLVCRNSCPSLRAWTAKSDLLRKREARKRKKGAAQQQETLGRRHEGISCSCDSNPFCLVSLGGAMDDFLDNAARKVLPLVSSDESVTPSPVIIDFEDVSTTTIVIDEKLLEQKRIHKDEVVNISDTDDDEPTTQSQSYHSLYHENKRIGSIFTRRKTAALPIETLSNVYTMELPVNESELDPNNEKSIYSKGTREHLQKLRKIANVNIGPILIYVDSVLKYANTMTPEEYIYRLRHYHKSMQFSNPLIQSIPTDTDMLTLAIPPGMKNLGATCYMNTQLQCLARNTVFLNGISSWRSHPNQINNPMEHVLEKLQQLLARMVYGSQRSISTEELSKAMGLETDEMQDPNEFARLLFERMHESFQQCAKISKEQESLGTLLPSLFQGIMTYATTCLKCKHTKQRNEQFMDLNLPIVQRSVVVPKKTGQQTLQESLACNKDTDVQFCLDQYLFREKLTGDNQYLCDQCHCKQDATRQVVFSELPPVLNLQLCRYVFDREKFVKTKLTDGVILNRTLEVPAKDKRSSATYILCAVMKHSGNSAYQGHYIAEAMDWQTGKWFEFNDDLVKILEKGSSCSNQNLDDGKGKAKLAKGSQDAYNMYYVRDSFLAKSAASSFTSDMLNEMRPSNGIEKPNPSSSMLAQVSSERCDLYCMLSNLCMHDGKVADQLRRRKLGLQSMLSGSLISDVTGEIEMRMITECQEDKEMVWIDGKALRMFFGDECEEEICSYKTAFPICEHHIGLHPRVARKGKLLPLAVSHRYTALRREEKLYMDRCNENSRTATIGEHKTLFVKDIICKECCLSYTAELQRKLALLRQVKELYDELDPKRETTLANTSESDEAAFAIAGKFITRFRNRVHDLLKGIDRPETELEGIDLIDLSDFLPDNSIKPASLGDELDRRVNSDILCKHGLCCDTVSKRAVRFVSEKTWFALKTVFPAAIELKKTRNKISEILPCEKCSRSNMEVDVFRERASQIFSSLPRSLLEGAKRAGRDELSMPKNADRNPSYDHVVLVYKKDVKRWRDAIALVAGKKIEGGISLKERLGQLLFPFANDDAELGTQRQEGIECLMAQWQPTSLICPQHKKCFFDNLFKSPTESKPAFLRLSPHLEALSHEEYDGYVSSIYELHLIIFYSESQVNSEEDAYRRKQLHQLLGDCYHPTVSVLPLNDVESGESSLGKCSVQGESAATRIFPTKCTEHCECYLRPGKQTVQKVEPKLSVLHIDRVNIDTHVEVPDIPNLSIRVCAVKPADIDKAIAEMSVSGCGFDDGPVSDLLLRRSGRKRKQLYSLGVVENEIIISARPTHNFAALRLFIYEKYPAFRLDAQLILVFPTLKESPSPIIIGEARNEVKGDEKKNFAKPLNTIIPFEWNTKAISDVLDIATKGRPMSDAVKMAAMSDMVLIRKFEAGSLEINGAKTTKGKPQVSNDTLMDALFEIANLSDSIVTSVGPAANGQKECTRRPERGFRGTLLSISNQSETEDSNRDIDIDEIECMGHLLNTNSNLVITDVGAPGVETSNIHITDLSDDEEDLIVIESHLCNDSSGVINLAQSPAAVNTKVSNNHGSSGRQAKTTSLKREEIMLSVLNSLEDGAFDIDIDKMNDAITWALAENSNNSLREIADAAFAKCMQDC